MTFCTIKYKYLNSIRYIGGTLCIWLLQFFTFKQCADQTFFGFRVRITCSLINWQFETYRFDTQSLLQCDDLTVANVGNQKLCGGVLKGYSKEDSSVCKNSFTLSCQETLSILVEVTNDVLKYPNDKTFTMSLKTQANALHPIWDDVAFGDIQVSLMLLILTTFYDFL